MSLEKLLKESAAQLEQLMKQPVLDRIDAAALALPETQLKQRIADLDARIAALIIRRDTAIAAFDAAIAGDKAERDRLTSASPPVPPVGAVSTRRAAAIPTPKPKPKPKKKR